GTVTQVEFFIDGASIGAGTLSGGVWTRDWDTTAHADGVHTLLARATDDGGKTGEHSIQVTVDNNAAPTVHIDSPADGATVSATITIEASASDTGDDGGVVQVEFFVDGVSIGVDDSALGGWTTSWDTTTASDGPHTLKAIATDNGGKTAEHSIQVTVDNNAAPVISITHPANGQTVSGTITVSADTDDDVVRVEFSIPDVLYLGTDEDGSDGWSVSWDTTGLPDGEYMMNARATDAGGKSTLSAPVWVIVDNVPALVNIISPASGTTVAGLVNITASTSD